jgi:hypothetical protein
MKPTSLTLAGGARRRCALVIAGAALASAALAGVHAPANAAPPTGPIVGIGGKCLDNKEGTVANGNPVQLWACSGLSRQQWSFPGDGTIRVQGDHCLAVKNAGTVSTTPVWLWNCDSGPAQIWTVKANGTIVNNNSGLCLASKNAGTANGNPIWVYTCDAGPAQLWQAPASTDDPSGEPLPVGDLPGWDQVFTDNFSTAVPLGAFPAAVSGKWTAYTGQDTSGHGTYHAGKVVSVGNGVMNKHLHTENGVHYVAAALPKIPGHSGAYDGLTYGRYAVRFRVDQPANLAGYKTAWLLWPDSDNWQEGEVDFPEGNLTGTIGAFMHHRGNPQAQEQYPTSVTYGGWHTAVIEWTPQSVKFVLDDTVIGNDTATQFLPNTSMHWVLQTETTPSGPNNTAAGNVQIDWVAIWSRI